MGVGAETDGERQDGGRGKAAMLDEQSDARLQIASESHGQERSESRQERPFRRAGKRSAFGLRQPDDDRLGFEQLVAERLPVRELPLKLVPCLFVGTPLGDEGLIGVLDLCRQLLDDLELTLPRQSERRQMFVDEALEITHGRDPPRPAPPV